MEAGAIYLGQVVNLLEGYHTFTPMSHLKYIQLIYSQCLWTVGEDHAPRGNLCSYR